MKSDLIHNLKDVEFVKWLGIAAVSSTWHGDSETTSRRRFPARRDRRARGASRSCPVVLWSVANFLQIVNDPARQPVFAHCVGGRHRTGVMTAAYRMSHDQWNSNQAFSERKQYKFGLDMLHAEFKDFVYAYQPAVVATAAGAVAAASVR